MKQTRDHLDNQAANLWLQYPETNNQKAKQLFWSAYDGLLAEAKLLGKNRLQPVAMPRREAVDNTDWSQFLAHYLSGLNHQVTFTEPKVAGCTLLFKIVFFICLGFVALASLVAASALGLVICIALGVLVAKRIKHQSETVYYTFEFHPKYMRCIKKTVYSKSRQYTIDLPVPYASIHTVQKKTDYGIKLINATGQPWVASNHRKFSKVNIPAGITHLENVRNFLDTVAKYNRQLNP